MGEAPRDSFRILIATDNHLGFAERDPVRGDDSFETFEEILAFGAEAKVDFILLGGDLFHENKPSRQSVVRCMDLLRKYTFGDRPVLFDFLSDPAENFQHSKNPIPNYLDPNLNVSIPVFSIHGNHDDPSGLGSHCALEMLSTAGLINYFGRAKDLNRIEISPILLQKGRTKLALYGLCSLKDERLFRLFAEEKVSMLRPHEDTEDWFNMFVLHQNHTKHGTTNYIPEAFLHSFLDLVVWGHEHECIINPQPSGDNNFHIIQPGSSVVTSLCASEAVEKKVAILEITHEKKFKVDIHKLKTVRPFVIEDFSLVDNNLQDALEVEVKSYIKDKIDEMVIKAEEQHTGHPKQPKKPLVRLRVLYTNERQLFNGIQVGQLFEDIVANPTDIILFKKEGEVRKKEAEFNEEVMDALFEAKAMKARVEDLVEKYFAEVEEKRQLSLLTERGLALSVKNFIDKDDTRAVADIVAHQTKKMMSYLKEERVEADDDVVLERINEYRQQRMVRKNQKQMEEEAAAVINDPKRERSRNARGSDDDGDEDAFIDDDIEEIEVRPARGRGSRGGRARGGRGSRASSRAASSSASASSRGKRNTKPQLDMSSIGSPKSTSRGNRGRGSSTSRQSTLLDYSQRSQSQTTSNRSRGGVVFDSDSD